MPVTGATIAVAFPVNAFRRKTRHSMSRSVCGASCRPAGYRVIMTRDQDVFVPLGTRVAIANAYRNATFVSIHFNCSTRSGANGIETYYYRSDSAGLAASIHRNVVASVPTENRGIRRRGFFVLRRTAIPSVLVECGFLTNPTEGRLAQTDSYRQKLAEQIARGIRRQPAPFNRPLTSSLAKAGLYGPQASNAGENPDFVRADAVRERSSKSSKQQAQSRPTTRRAAKRKQAATTTKRPEEKDPEKEVGGLIGLADRERGGDARGGRSGLRAWDRGRGLDGSGRSRSGASGPAVLPAGRESASFMQEKVITAAMPSWRPSACSVRDGRLTFASHFLKAIAAN